MWIPVVLALLTALIFGGYWSITGDEHQQVEAQTQGRAMAENMVIFHQAAVQYVTNLATTNPASLQRNASLTIAQVGNSTLKASPVNLSALQSWYVASGPWIVATGDDPSSPGTVRIVATYLRPDNTNNINASYVAQGLSEITTGSSYVGIAAANGTVVSASPWITGASNTRLPYNGPTILVREGSAVIVTRFR